MGWGNGKVFDGRVYTGWLIGKVLDLDSSESHNMNVFTTTRCENGYDGEFSVLCILQ